MVVVLGKGGRRIPKDEALAYVFGYAVGNEISVRDYQFKSPQWTVGKNFDGTGAWGPYVVTADELPAGGKGLKIETRLNGQTVQSSNTDDMIYDVATVIATVSEAITLQPGDIISRVRPPASALAALPSSTCTMATQWRSRSSASACCATRSATNIASEATLPAATTLNRRRKPVRKIEVPVFIAGAGPTGLTATCLLATQGIETLTITRYPGTANSPRAHITNQRTMEVFRDLGIEPRVLQAATPSELMSNNIWATSFAGTEIARLQTWGTLPERKVDYEMASPSGMCNIPQHLMEPILLDVARERGGKFLFNTELISMKQDAEQVHAICRDRITGEEFEVVSQYAIGADGDNSVVVKEIGFPTEGQMGLGAAVNVWVEADLTKYVAHRPGVLYWMTQPGNNYWVGSGTWISVRPWNEWVLLFMYDPSQGEPDLSEAALQERARATIGDPEIPIRIKAVSKWTINHVVAKNMNKGRVLIAGNAAHRHPPANGLGTNTCVQDTFNLAWKLALVLKGKAGPALLDTYTAERQPVGEQVVNRAMKSVRDMLPISDAWVLRRGRTRPQAGPIFASCSAIRRMAASGARSFATLSTSRITSSTATASNSGRCTPRPPWSRTARSGPRPRAIRSFTTSRPRIRAPACRTRGSSADRSACPRWISSGGGGSH